MGKLDQILDRIRNLDLFLYWKIRVKVLGFEPETKLCRILKHHLGNQKTEHIARSLLDQPHIKGIGLLLGLNPAVHTLLTAVITCRNCHPVTILAVSFQQETACCLGCLIDIVSLIDIGIYLQSVRTARTLGKLPQACRSCTRCCLRIKIALNNHEVFKVIGHTHTLKDRFNHREILVSPLYHEGRCGVRIGKGYQFTVHAFTQVGTVQFNSLTCKHHTLRYRRRKLLDGLSLNQ